jgi:uncharacterized transporter YbjL
MSQTVENKSEEVGGGDPSASMAVLIGIVGAILTFVVIVALQAMFYNAEEQASRVHLTDDSSLATRLRSEQLETINTYRWKDREKGLATIPIDRAMDRIVEQEAAKRSQ